jgi:hypothetical protein
LRTRYWTPELEGVGALRWQSGHGRRGRCIAEGAVVHQAGLRLAPCRVGSPGWGERRVAVGKGGVYSPTPTTHPTPIFSNEAFTTKFGRGLRICSVITTDCYGITAPLQQHYNRLLWQYCIITASLQQNYYRLLQHYCTLQRHYFRLLWNYCIITSTLLQVTTQLLHPSNGIITHYYHINARLLHHYNILTTNYCSIASQLQHHYYRLQ